ncbi:hypothetical protein SUGI_0885020 [Cryptomeria japonica]|nr:hypothetical protein SUGI_0885020 [Cryptomeria japonica]
MLEYLHQQVDSYVTGSGNLSTSSRFQTTVKLIGDALQGFVKSKRSMFRHVSSKLLYGYANDKKIEEFVQELERTGSWLAGKRENERISASNHRKWTLKLW